MGIIKGFFAMIGAIKWVMAQRKLINANADAYFTQERALEWRLYLEKIGRILESGSIFLQKLKRVPAPIRWFFNCTTADNRIGQFGQWLLKSKKLETGDKVLNQPLYRTH